MCCALVMSPGICVLPHVSASAVVDFDAVQFGVSQIALEFGPHQRTPLNLVVKGVPSMDEEISSCLFHRPALSSVILDDCECDSENLSKGPVWRPRPLRDEELYFLVESDDFFAFVVTEYVAARVIEHEQEYPACSQWNTAREGMRATTVHKESWC